MRALFNEVLGEDNDVVVHTFRHTAATWMAAQKDLPLPSVAAYLGMTTETLVKTYAHHREEDLQKIAEAIFDSNRDTHKFKLRETERKHSENVRQKSTVIDRMEIKRSA
jgi:integrase